MSATSTAHGRLTYFAVRVLALVAGMLALADAQQARTGGTDDGAQPPLVPVEVTTVKVADAREEIRVVGTLIADESVTLRPEVAGRIQSVEFKEGQRVEQGQVLFRLDPAEFQAQVASTEAAAKLGELKFARAKDLLARKVMSQQEYDEAQEVLKVARARLELERVRLDKTVIKAPFGGILGLREVSPGAYVQTGQDLVGLAAIDPIKVEFSVPERHAAAVGVGQPLTVTVETFPDRAFSGEIYAIDPSLDDAARSLRVRGRLPNPAGQLRPGMFARVALPVSERKDAIWVPEEALVPLGNDRFVYRVENGKALLTKIEIGGRRVGEVEIRNGLKAGDSIVTAGQARLQDQAAVRIVNQPS
ncbi:MAG: efflux RND transporter periplasmic adaptor subunit [Chromatiales bacterium]